MGPRRLSHVLVLCAALALGRAAAPRAERRAGGVAGHTRIDPQGRAPGGWPRPRHATATPRARTLRRRSRSGLRLESGVRVEILRAGRAAGRPRRRTSSQPGLELRGLRGIARGRRSSAHRRRPRDGGRGGRSALRPDALAPHAIARRREAARRGRAAARLDRPGVEVGGGLALGGRRPRRASSPRSGRSPARSRCAGSASRPQWIPPSRSATPFQLATTITDGHGGVLPGVSVGWTSTDTSVARWTAPAPSMVRSPGATTIVAAAGGRIAQSRILVRPRPGGHPLLRRHAGPASGRRHGRASSRAWSTRRRHPVLGQALAWRSRDASMAAVDSLARLTAGDGRPHGGGRHRAATSTAELPLEVIPFRGRSRCSPETASTRRRGTGCPFRSGRRSCRAAGGHCPASPSGLAPDDGTAVEPAVDTSECRRHRAAAVDARRAAGAAADALVVDGDAADRHVSSRPTRIRCPRTPASPSPARRHRGAWGPRSPGTIAVRVTDSTGAPAAGLPVAWSTPDDGAIEGQAARTDSLGEARARWTLGSRAGSQQVPSCRSGAHARCRGSRSSPRRGRDRRQRWRGAGSASARGRRAAARRPLEFRVTDRANNPVPGCHGDDARRGRLGRRALGGQRLGGTSSGALDARTRGRPPATRGVGAGGGAPRGSDRRRPAPARRPTWRSTDCRLPRLPAPRCRNQ